jgi:hypothetical protein
VRLAVAVPAVENANSPVAFGDIFEIFPKAANPAGASGRKEV